MNAVYNYIHYVADVLKFAKWKIIILPILFCFIGFYIEISVKEPQFITFKSIVLEKIFAIVLFVIGLLLPISFWQLYIKRFSKNFSILWNKKGLSFAFLSLIFAAFLQFFAIWGDRSWDKIYVQELNGYYTETQLNAVNENAYSQPNIIKTAKNNGITQLHRQLSAFMPFQVGEFVKIFFLIFIAKLITDMIINNQMRICKHFFILPFLAILPIGFFAYCMPNYSMLIIYALMLFFLLFLQKMTVPLKVLFIIILVIPLFIIIPIKNLDKDNAITKIHGVTRIWSFFNENSSGNDQQNEALQALADGGVIGKGLVKGTIKNRLFGAHNDFVYDILGEELGMWLMIPITIALSGFLFTCFWVANEVKIKNTPIENYSHNDINALFAQNLAWGIAIIFSLNIFFHIGVNLKLLPNTGQPLPFISSGGANLMTNFFLIGMLVQISSLNKGEKV